MSLISLEKNLHQALNMLLSGANPKDREMILTAKKNIEAVLEQEGDAGFIAFSMISFELTQKLNNDD